MMNWNLKRPCRTHLSVKHPLLSEYIKLLLGTLVLVTLSAVAFYYSTKAAGAIETWKCPDYAQFLFKGSVLALFFLLIGGCLLYGLNWPIVNLLNVNANKLAKATKALCGDDTGQVGVLVDIQNMITTHRTQRNIGEIALVEREFDNLQKAFLKHSGVSDVSAKTLTLRIVGTMLGTYGQYGLGLADEISDLFKKKVGHGRPPFRVAYFGAPGHLDGVDEQAYNGITGTGLNCLYPYSARITACKLLLSVCETLNNELHGEVGDTLRVNIRYVPVSDIFPAIQLWGDECGMVLFSTGHQDRQSARALPVAVMLKKEVSVYGTSSEPVTFNLAKTLERLNQHLKHDFGLHHPSQRMESWELDTISRTLCVASYQSLLEQARLRVKILHDRRTAPKVDQIDQFNQFMQSGAAVPVATLASMIDEVGGILQTLTTPVTV